MGVSARPRGERSTVTVRPDRRRPRRHPGVAPVVMALAAGLVLGACNTGSEREPIDSASARSTTADGDGSSRTTGGSGGAASSFDRTASESRSDLERRVSDTLSDLAAEVHDGDTVVTLPDTVLFDFDEAELRPDAAEVLDRLVEVIEYAEGAPVRVEGHTDSVGSPAHNQQLSERRARAVVDHLVAAGVDPARLTATGHADTRPVAPNTHDDGSDDPEGRARNRRVEIVIEGLDMSGAATGG